MTKHVEYDIEGPRERSVPKFCNLIESSNFDLAVQALQDRYSYDWGGIRGMSKREAEAVINQMMGCLDVHVRRPDDNP
jgi:hypothetical protein